MPKITTDMANIEHERLLSLINSMVDGVIAVDDSVRVVNTNGAALNILDVNSSLIGKPLSDYCVLLDANNQAIDVTELIASTTAANVSRDLRLRYGDGSTIHLYLSIAPVHSGYSAGGVDAVRGRGGYVLLLRDISREKSLEEERDEFISVVSHELRTPIAIAEGNISNAEFVIDNGGTLQDARAALSQAHEQTIFLASMINDLSTLSRAEHGTLKVEIEALNLQQLLESLEHSYKADAEAKGLQLVVQADPQLELIQSSKLYVREIMQNFITNAIKYTQSGHITIGAKPEAKGVTLWVEDTGIGISIGDQERIYDKFFRSEDYRTRTSNGTGLGLYVTLKLARLLHAQISTSSTINKGSKFSIYVPSLA